MGFSESKATSQVVQNHVESILSIVAFKLRFDEWRTEKAVQCSPEDSRDVLAILLSWSMRDMIWYVWYCLIMCVVVQLWMWSDDTPGAQWQSSLDVLMVAKEQGQEPNSFTGNLWSAWYTSWAQYKTMTTQMRCSTCCFLDTVYTCSIMFYMFMHFLSCDYLPIWSWNMKSSTRISGASGNAVIAALDRGLQWQKALQALQQACGVQQEFMFNRLMGIGAVVKA